MKLKNLLILAFLVLTFIPIAISSFLLYESGFSLSKESYTRNLIESIHVQEDYITQTIENNMISDYRFASRVLLMPSVTDSSEYVTAFQSYLEASEDRITVSLMLDKNNAALYTIGEKKLIDIVMTQLPQLSELEKQTMLEFKLSEDTYSLGVISPVYDNKGAYAGSLISIYDKSYIFKIISSYYEITDSSSYICRENGDIINFRGLSSPKRNEAIEQTLAELLFTSEGVIDTRVGTVPVLGYYKNIYSSPWYLVGFIDDSLIYSFTNQFVLVYILIIAAVLITDVCLAFYFSRKVVEPINHLIKIMDGYQNDLTGTQLQFSEKRDYYETRYLRTKFFDLMKTILLVQHNYQGIYQLYQSSDMGDTNIEIHVMNQTAHSNKAVFQDLMNNIVLPENACIIERFTNCFCEKDKEMLTAIFEEMRDEQLSVTREAEIYTPQLGQKWFHILVVPMYNGNRLSSLFIQLRDITSFKKQEQASHEQAIRDSLTGLYNRSGFTDCVNTILQTESQNSKLHGLLFIDMDYFKMVNDNFGHGEGDNLLRTISHIFTDSINVQNVASRFGGDEFVIFLPDTTTEEIHRMKEELGQLLLFPYQTEQISFIVSASIGISIWSQTSPDTLDELLQQADTAMYQAKREFKSTHIS